MKLRTLTLLLLFSLPALAQQGYNLQFKVDGLKDTTVYLGYYYGESTYVKDTTRVNGQGEFAFTGSQPLAQGVYFLVLDKTRVMEMVIGEDQTFQMHTNAADYVKNMKVSGDLDNKLFFENMLFSVERNKEAAPYVKVVQDSTAEEKEKSTAREALTKINNKVIAYHKDIIAKHPKTFTARMFKINQPIVVPDPPAKPDGTIDSTFQLRWYREHFFDNMDLSDDAMIRLPRPIYKEKVNEYLDKLFVPHADTINKAIDKLVSMAKNNQETYKFMVYTNLIKYQNPEYMGLDGVFVHLYDKYFASGEMNFWANDKFKKNLKEHADRLRNSLVGMKAPNLIMQDANFQPRSMYDIKEKYTILFFFDPDCGHCKKETPKLVDFYDKTKLSVEVYAVSADTSMAKMRDYIRDLNMKWITVNGPRTYVGHYQDLYDAMTTPMVYILDEKKKVIAKKIPTEKIEEFLTNYEKLIKKGSTTAVN